MLLMNAFFPFPTLPITYLFCFILQAESSGHAKALGKAEKRKNAFAEQSRRIFKEDVTLYERLGHLRVSEGWE